MFITLERSMNVKKRRRLILKNEKHGTQAVMLLKPLCLDGLYKLTKRQIRDNRRLLCRDRKCCLDFFGRDGFQPETLNIKAYYSEASSYYAIIRLDEESINDC